MKKAILPVLLCLLLFALLAACASVPGGRESASAPPSDSLPERSAVILPDLLPDPEPTPVPTAEPTPTLTPEPSQAPAPTAAPEPEPSPTPDPTPEPTPEPAPEPTPEPEPNGGDGDRSAPDALSPVRDYVLNTNTLKFHYPDCRSVDQMKEENKAVFTGSREEILDMGYVPCKNCDP